MSAAEPEIRDLLHRLRSTPQHFKRTAAGLTEAQLQRPPAKGEWSVNEVLAHLRGCADVNGMWIARMLAEDAPTIRYASPRTGMRKGNYAAQPFVENLRGYTQQRAELVKTLSALPLKSWDRNASFTGTKPGWTPTVLDVARGLAGHDHAHFAQITEAADASR